MKRQLAILLAGLIPAAGAMASGSLSEAARADCHREVAQVYWQARIWPESNPRAKPAFSERVGSAAIAAIADQVVARSVALETYWNVPITGPMLQAELERMARSSRRPQLLRQLFDALENDPLRLAECLARPSLAERLLRQRFDSDPSLAAQPFSEWWAANRPSTQRFVAPAWDYTVPAIRVASGSAGQWFDTASAPLRNSNGNVRGTAVWTGTEMVYFNDFAREAYRYDPALDVWQTTSTLGGPLGLRDTTAVWTGEHVIASHGCTANNHNCTTGAAWRYDPQLDRWESLPSAPISRTDQSAVWTGTEMLVWGGCTYAQDACQVYSSTGARFNPSTNQWQLMSSDGAPPGRSFLNLLWTGSEMIVWGGLAGNPSGGRYDPTTDTWQGMSQAGAPAGAIGSAVWSGSEMLAWGGCTGSPQCNIPSATGARYRPDTDTWSAMSTDNAPAARFFHTAVWAGSEMIVWGGYDGTAYLNSGARYDPAGDRWTGMSTSNAPVGRRDHQFLWTGSKVLVWGGFGGPGDMRSGARYDVASDTWAPIDTSDPDTLRTNHSAVWTGAEMIVWGGAGDNSASTGMNTGRRYDPATDSWSATSTVAAPPGAWDASAVWTGSEVIVWGGQSGSQVRDTGARYDPVSDSWTPMATNEGRTDNAYVWSGTEMLVWGGSTPNSPWTDTGARYDPVSNSWAPMSTIGAPSPRTSHGRAAWSGSEMLVWGGFGPTGEVAGGGRYDPQMDAWSTISSSGAPSPRYGHALVWDGQHMIVWGGAEYSPEVLLASGGRYDPSKDSWSAISLDNAPMPARFASTVWTGTEMIVWGGICNQPTQPTCHTDSYEGGRYDPGSDQWTATSLDGVPEARSFHSAVWTGDAMIVWGGIGTWSGYRNTGGVYRPQGPLPDMIFAGGFE